MDLSKTRGWLGVVALTVGLPATVMSACTSDDENPAVSRDGGSDGSTSSSGATSSSSSSSSTSSSSSSASSSSGSSSSSSSSGSSSGTSGEPDASPDAAPDASPDASPDATPDASSPDADAASEAAAPTALDDGAFTITAWICTHAGGGTVDIKAYAATLGIQSVVETFAGATGSVETNYAACKRTVPISSITYADGKVTTTVGGARTCGATCPAGQCTAGTEPDVVATYAFTKDATTTTFERTLDAAFFGTVSLQSLAGCVAGDVETTTLTKN